MSEQCRQRTKEVRLRYISKEAEIKTKYIGLD